MGFNFLGTFMTPEGKGRKGGDILRNFIDPSRLGGLFDKPKESAPAVTPMPEAPKSSDAAATAETNTQKRAKKSQSYQSIFSSPLGIQDQANVVKKTLLGE